MLRQNYKDRTSGRELLTSQPKLLALNPKTIEANVQFLYNVGIDYYDAILLGTTSQLKRKKMAWMLRELFDYRDLTDEERRDAINRLYDFVRENPRVLAESLRSLERRKEKLKERITISRR